MDTAPVVRILCAAALVLAGLTSGCAGKLEQIRPGMMFTDVEDIMKEPLEVIHGEGVEVDKTIWVYTQGRVVFEACTVVKVEKIAATPTMTERVEQQRGTR
jgi:hypothetical protein